MEMYIYVRVAHSKGQWETFFWPLAEGALLKWRHVHNVYYSPIHKSETLGIFCKNFLENIPLNYCQMVEMFCCFDYFLMNLHTVFIRK